MTPCSHNFRNLTCLVIRVCMAISLLGITPNLQAQSTKPLNIGDTIPDLVVADMIKPLAGALTTKSLYSDGMLIISFWATCCRPCVREIEFLAKEVDGYQGKLNVIYVSDESKTVVQDFLDKHPSIVASALVVTGADTVFKKMFFHQSLPHNVWIDQEGCIKAITGTGEVTSFKH